MKPTLGANTDKTIVLLKQIALWRTVMVRNSVTCDDVSGATPGAHEKGLREPYQDPTLVPLVKKTKACRLTVAKGIRQISPVTSEEGVPALKKAGRSDEGALTV
jgi:hypothetical protein